MDAKTDGTRSLRFVPWAPGGDGKGFLTTGDSRRLEVWKVGEDLSPHVGDGLTHFGIDQAELAVAFYIIRGELIVFPIEVAERPWGEVLRELDPRLPPEPPETEFMFG